MLRSIVPLLLLSTALPAAVVDDDVNLELSAFTLGMSHTQGGMVHTFKLPGRNSNLAGSSGILMEGFGIGSHYVPSRRTNEKLEALEEFQDRPVLRYSYDCEGPNIEDLHVTRLMEPMPDSSSVQVTWTVENRGKEKQWLAPWVRNSFNPGGSVTEADRFDVPSLNGVVQAQRSNWYPAARNWVAATDPAAGETIYAVFDADQTYAFLALREPNRNEHGFQMAFVPIPLEPGKSWTTRYSVNAVLGLKRVDFATDELAAQIDYADGQFAVLISPVKPMPEVEIRASIKGPNDRVWQLPAKRFSEVPAGKIGRASWEWTAPADGAYEFMAKLLIDGKQFELGKRTSTPHGGIDTQFVVGKPVNAHFEPWTDAPYSWEKSGRVLNRTLAAQGDVTVWAESSLEKIFRTDTVKAVGAVDPTVRISLAQNEYEGFQLALRPGGKQRLVNMQVQVSDLASDTGGRIASADVSVSNVHYVQVRVPSHLEGPTGMWPDALPPYKPTTIEPGVTTPLWFTLHAGKEVPSGIYRGTITLAPADVKPTVLTLEARVHNFALPDTPALKTDFGFQIDAAVRGSKLQGGNANERTLATAYLNNALAHRVTLRDIVRLPLPGGNYADSLKTFEPFLKQCLAKGATTIAVSPMLLEKPNEAKLANAFIKRLNLQNRAFVPLADLPPEQVYPRLEERVALWESMAPDIPVLVTTQGLRPYIPPTLDLWALHLQVFDTGNYDPEIKTAIEKGKETWLFVNHTPSRPYGNFFVDFSSIEHRILFWQSWALGVRGMHYWSINFVEPHQNPWQSLLDLTPVNGDGVLVYPGADGPVNTIRWENIRDGIEDYDYLMLFTERVQRLRQQGKSPLLDEAVRVFNMKELVPTLVSFPRDAELLLNKRAAVAATIERMDEALGR